LSLSAISRAEACGCRILAQSRPLALFLASRIPLPSARRSGERSGKGDRKANVAPRDISTLSDLGIPRDREAECSSRRSRGGALSPTRQRQRAALARHQT
jgi:hypothetical protein